MASGRPSSARQMAATLGDVPRPEHEAGRRRGRPLGEQPDRVVALRSQVEALGAVSGGSAERRHLPDALGGDAQRLAAGGDDLESGRAGQQPLAQAGARVDQVLAVVQHQQHAAMPEGLGERVEQRPAWLLVDADDGGQPGHDVLGLPQVAELDEPGAVREVARDGVEQPEREPRLADAAGAAQGHRAHHAQQLTQLADLGRAADETAELFRPVAASGMGICIPGYQRRRVGRTQAPRTTVTPALGVDTTDGDQSAQSRPNPCRKSAD